MSGARSSSRAPRTIFVLPSATTRQRTHLLFNTDALASLQGASKRDVLASNKAARGPAPTVSFGNLLGASSSSSSTPGEAAALDWIDAQRTLLALRRAYWRAQLDHQLAQVELRALTAERLP